VQEWELLSFQPAQVTEFIEKWFWTRPEVARRLVQELRQNPQMQGLAEVPLLAALICLTFWYGELKLPVRRVELYRQAISGLLGKWHEKKEWPLNFPDDTKKNVLEELALYFYPAGEFPKDALHAAIRKILGTADQPFDRRHEGILKELSQYAGILKVDGTESYSFLHRTFQECLVARALARRGDWQETVEYWLNGFWEPRAVVIELLAGELPDAGPLIELLLAHDDPRPWKEALRGWRPGQRKDPFGEVLLLASRCVAEAGQVQARSLAELDERVVGRLGNDPFPKRAGECLAWLAKRWPRAFESLLQALANPLNSIHGIALRVVAAWALGQVAERRALEPLLRALGEEEGPIGGVRAAAAS
jgi:hypothetical protein